MRYTDAEPYIQYISKYSGTDNPTYANLNKLGLYNSLSQVHLRICRHKFEYGKRKLTSTEDFATTIASGCKLRVVAIATVDLISLGAKLLVNQGHTTLVAQETCLMPMLLLVRQILKKHMRKKKKKNNKYLDLCFSHISFCNFNYLRINSNDLVALLACIGKYILVAFNAVRMIITQNVTLTGQALIALPAAKVARVPVL